MTGSGLQTRHALGVQMGLEAVAHTYAALGRPIEGRRAVHVVGTNGKGSTATFLEYALRRCGWRTGLYTSPHLHRIGERIRVEGVAVSDAEVHARVDEVAGAEAAKTGPRALTFFELLTLAAFMQFERANVDVAIIEAGLGGGRDATRVMQASAVAITSIGMDHEAMIGPTRVEIAQEKAGAMAPRVPVFSVPQVPEVRRVLEESATRLGCPLHWVEPWVAPPPGQFGDVQRINAALAQAVGQWLEPQLGPDALAEVSIPARMEYRARGAGGLWLDVAHNPDGIRHLTVALARAPQRRPSRVVWGCHADKDGEAMAAALGDLNCPSWWVALDAGQPPPPGASPQRCWDGPDDPALTMALDACTSEGETVLVCGSHAVVGPLRAWALGLETRASLQDPRPAASATRTAGP